MQHEASKMILLDYKTTETKKTLINVKTYKPYTRMIQSLNKKGLVFSKADKGNAVVVMNREYYTNRINELLSEGITTSKEKKSSSSDGKIKIFR